MSNKTLLLIRHAEAVKNREDKHGGSGSLLVENAEESIKISSNNIAALGVPFQNILCSAQIHCEQTATIMGQSLVLPVTKSEILRPIFLGVIDGLSNKEVEHLYPEMFKSLLKWRNGEIEINQLSIPKMESHEDFYARGKEIVNFLETQDHSTIIVTSRSVLVLLASVLLQRKTTSGGNYREIKWNNLDYLVFSFSENGTSLHIDLSTVRI